MLKFINIKTACAL